MARMFNPPHPSETIKREDILPALNLSVTEAAGQLGVTEPPSPGYSNGHAAISPKWPGASKLMKHRPWRKRPTLAGHATDYDLWTAEQRPARRLAGTEMAAQ